jgi:hypothetical protein
VPCRADFQREELTNNAALLNDRMGGLIAEVMREDGFTGKNGETLLLHPAGKSRRRDCFWSVLASRKNQCQHIAHRCAKAARQVRAIKKDGVRGGRSLGCDLSLPGITPELIGGTVVEGILLGLHSFDDFQRPMKTRFPKL